MHFFWGNAIRLNLQEMPDNTAYILFFNLGRIYRGFLQKTGIF